MLPASTGRGVIDREYDTGLIHIRGASVQFVDKPPCFPRRATARVRLLLLRATEYGNRAGSGPMREPAATPTRRREDRKDAPGAFACPDQPQPMRRPRRAPRASSSSACSTSG